METYRFSNLEELVIAQHLDDLEIELVDVAECRLYKGFPRKSCQILYTNFIQKKSLNEIRSKLCANFLNSRVTNLMIYEEKFLYA